MPTYIALLRGVNVGKSVLDMARLREWFTALDFEDVRTYIRSGNVIFRDRRAAPKCRELIEAKLTAELGKNSQIVLRTPEQFASIIASNPFLKDKSVDHSKLHVTLLRDSPANGAAEALTELAAGADRFSMSETEVFVYCPNGYSETKLSNKAIERACGVPATTRNWNTVNKLLDMAR